MTAATRTSLERLIPLALGLAAGFGGFLLAPDHATVDFFSAAAQIVPVLLLALAVEAGLLRLPRARRGDEVARRIDFGRRILEAATIVVLLAAETHALSALDDSAGGDPWLIYAGLAWGFATIGSIAFRGTGRPRVTADVEIDRVIDEGVVLRISLGNEFGDRDVRPLSNIGFGPDDVEVYEWDEEEEEIGDLMKLPIRAPVDDGEGRIIPCRFSHDHPVLTAGDVGLVHVVLKIGEEALVVVRLDHAEFRGGRVQHAAFVDRGPSVSPVANAS